MNLFWRHADWLEAAARHQGRLPVYINLDETNVAYSYHSARGWMRLGMKPKVNIPSRDRRGSITHVALVSNVLCVQQHLPQMLICNTRRLSKTLLSRLRRTKPANVVLLRRASSWNNAGLMRYLLQLLGDVFRRAFADYQAVLVMDCAPMHLVQSVVREARLQQIWLLPVAPAMTKYIQPLDVYVFSQYKRFLEHRNRDIRGLRGSVDVEAWFKTIFDVCTDFLCNRAWWKAFSLVGLPLDLEQSLSRDLVAFFPGNRTVFPTRAQLSQEELAMLLPKRYKMVYEDWVGAPRRVAPVLS